MNINPGDRVRILDHPRELPSWVLPGDVGIVQTVDNRNGRAIVAIDWRPDVSVNLRVDDLTIVERSQSHDRQTE